MDEKNSKELKLKLNWKISKKTLSKSPDENYRDSPGNAEIERLVTKLDTLRDGRLNQIVLITSAVLGEGKSTLASRIALSSARNRKKPTLLVDFDLRRPRLHQIFRVKESPGVAEILRSTLPLEFCFKKTSVPNLMLLPSGKLRDNPVDLLCLDKLDNLFTEVRTLFDNVIIDSPPTIPVSEPLVLGKSVDNVILVIKAGATSKQVVKCAIDMFYDVGIDISGIVLNNMNNVLPYYYDYKYYHYGYYGNGKTRTSSSSPVQKLPS
ncbi:MAG: tyrosine-protein kinase family protein [bacterium]